LDKAHRRIMEQQRQQQQAGMVEVVMEVPPTSAFQPQQTVYCMPAFHQQFQFQPVMQPNVNNMWRPVGFEQPAQKMAPAPVVYYQVAAPQQVIAQPQQPLDYDFENSDELVGLLCFDDEVQPTQTDDAKSVASASTCDASVVETADIVESTSTKTVVKVEKSSSTKKRKHDVLESEDATYRKMIAASLSGSKRSVQFCSVCFNVRRRDGELVNGHRSDGYCPVKKHRATAEEKRELRRIRQKVRRSINRKLRDQNQQQQKLQQQQPQQQQQPPVAQPGFVYNGWNQCNEVQVL